MSRFPYTLATNADTAFGLIVLQVDETIESDFRRLFPDPATVTLYVSRIPSGAELTPETIARMEVDLPRAAALLPQAPVYASVSYACTSGTTLIGPERVMELVAGGCRTLTVCNPLSAAQAACRHLGAERIGIVSPYRPDVAEPVCAAFEAAGITVSTSVHFGEEIEANVARIAPQSIKAAAREAARGSCDAVFLSCTNLRTLEVIPTLEREMGLPVFGSNLALAWAMGRTAGPGFHPVGNFALLRSEPALTL